MNKSQNQQPHSRDFYLFAFRTFGDFGVTIAVPAVVAALVGKWLDTQQDTSPRYVIIFLIIAFVITAIMITRKVKIYGKMYEKLTNSQNTPQK